MTRRQSGVRVTRALDVDDETKRRIVKLKKQAPELTGVHIAERLGLSPTTVQDVLRDARKAALL